MDALGAFAPMEGTGTEIDMLSRQPAPVVAAERKAQQEQRKQHRQRAALLLVEELGRGGPGRTILTRLVQDAFVMLYGLLADTQDRDNTWLAVQALRVRIGVLQETLGPDVAVLHEAARYQILDILASALNTYVTDQLTAYTERE